jgi:hypothetical protein
MRAYEQYLFSSLASFYLGWLTLSVAIMFYPTLFAIDRQKYINEEDQWARCVFEQKYYVQLGLSQANDWKKTCGEAMYSIFNASGGEVLYCAFIFIMAGQSIVFWVIRLPQRIRNSSRPTLYEQRRLVWIDRMRSAYARSFVRPQSVGLAAARVAPSPQQPSVESGGGHYFLSVGPLTALHAAFNGSQQAGFPQSSQQAAAPLITPQTADKDPHAAP